MQKLLTIIAVILLAATTTNAQNMLGADYATVKETYKEYNNELTDIKEGITKNGVPFISYTHKDDEYGMHCFFQNGYVVKYVISDVEDKANYYAKIFNAEFVPMTKNVWIDHEANCTWILEVEDGMVFLQAYQNDKD